MARKRQTDKNSRQDTPDLLQLPREELLHIAKQSGILEKAQALEGHESPPSSASAPPPANQANDDEEEYPLAEEIFAATTLLIPVSFLLLMMYM